jgi:hypothetical protein
MMHVHPPKDWTLRGLVRWAALAFLTVFGGLLVEENGRNYIEEHHLQTLWAKAFAIMPDLSNIIASQWFWAALWASGGFTGGAWLDAALRRREQGGRETESVERPIAGTNTVGARPSPLPHEVPSVAPTAPPDSSPKTRFYSARQKEELAEGIQEIRIGLGNLSDRVDHVTQTALQAIGALRLTQWSHREPGGGITDEKLSTAVTSLKQLADFLRPWGSSSFTTIEFINDPIYKDEIDSIIDVRKYNAFVANLSATTRSEIIKIETTLDEFNKHHDIKTTRLVMEPAMQGVAHLSKGTQLLKEWIKVTQDAAALFQKSL